MLEPEVAMFYVAKWFAFAAGGALELASGFNTAFSLYAPAFGSELGYSSMKVQCVGSAIVSTGLLAIIPGIIFDRLRARPRVGPR